MGKTISLFVTDLQRQLNSNWGKLFSIQAEMPHAKVFHINGSVLYPESATCQLILQPIVVEQYRQFFKNYSFLKNLYSPYNLHFIKLADMSDPVLKSVDSKLVYFKT